MEALNFQVHKQFFVSNFKILLIEFQKVFLLSFYWISGFSLYVQGTHKFKVVSKVEWFYKISYLNSNKKIILKTKLINKLMKHLFCRNKLMKHLSLNQEGKKKILAVTSRSNFIVNLCVQVVNYYLSHLLSKINIRVFNKHIII